MPEGPSIIILREAIDAAGFKGKKVLDASGNTKAFDLEMLKSKVVLDFKSFGKHFLICFDDFTIRVHFLMFGSYAINERKDRDPRLSLKFPNGELNLYTCSVKIITEDLNEVYDWSADVMNPDWDAAAAKKKIKEDPDRLVCDVLLDQNIFAGVGNIIKNEVLFRVKIQPQTKVGALPAKKMNELIKESVNYSFDFLRWKKEFILKKQWLVNTKSTCSVCKGKIIRTYMGKTNRRTFYCPHCQQLYK
ncbi:MAG: endonuclease [Bacteroidetes bacterium]|nr:endonuclease [Bacteroidota bacterium]